MNAKEQGLIAGVDCAAWAALAATAKSLGAAHLRQLFDADASRGAVFSSAAVGLRLDYSRQRIDGGVVDLFARLADELRLRDRIEALFAGDPVNVTEGRAALHTALRRPASDRAALQVGGVDVWPDVLAQRRRMLAFAEAVRTGAATGSSGKPFDLVVNIGIGGSDLGPAMAVEALRPYTRTAPRSAFVANVDGVQLTDALEGADPARTLFIVCSKTFGTQETRANALAARRWTCEALGERAVPAHFVAVSVNAPAMDEFGIPQQHRFPMWDWVGGRYSIWSAIGLSLAIAIGADRFEEFLSGASALDSHFRTAPWKDNLPVLLGMLGVWNRNFLGLPTLAILPYSQRLARFPAYLQQLEMESNGKSRRMNGADVAVATCPIVWGEPGSMAQHSFFQLLHQGTPAAALDFLLPARSSSGRPDQQILAVANCLAQAEALAFGRPAPGGQPWKQYDGNRPSSVLLFRELDPATLGTLIALYEHKVFVQSVLWGINAFDQWGVELGKSLCESLLPLVSDAMAGGPATAGQRGRTAGSALHETLLWLKGASRVGD